MPDWAVEQQQARWEMKMGRTLKSFVAALAATAGIVAFGASAAANDVIRVGYGPFLSGGGLFIAQEKGYFNKMGITVELRRFDDGSLAVPAMIAGELELTNLPAAANLFNGIAKGAPIAVFADWGNNKPGRAYTAFLVSQKLYDEGLKTIPDLVKLKGKKVGVGALGSVNHYNAAQALLKAGLNPAKDVQWVVNIPQPDLMKMLGQGQLDGSDLSYNLAVFAKNNKMGQIVATGDEIAPNFQIAAFAGRKDFLTQKHDVMVRFMLAYLQGVKEFNAAAGAPDNDPKILDILAKYTTLNKPELIKAIAPNWAYLNEDGMPQIDSIMAMQDFWSGEYFQYVQKKVTREQLFDLSIAKEAKEKFDREKPFAN
jgi:NitT/TauT family transport system substrate-binding protein